MGQRRSGAALQWGSVAVGQRYSGAALQWGTLITNTVIANLWLYNKAQVNVEVIEHRVGYDKVLM